MMDRRTFSHAVVTSLAALRANHSGAATKLGPIGIQLYTVRDLFAKKPEATLNRLAQAGYREVEFAGYNKLPVKAIRGMLERNGLTAPSAHIDLTDIRTRWPAVLDFAKEVGHRYLVLAYLDRADRYALDSYRKVADLLNQAATAAKKVGIEVAYHNHDFEFIPIDGQTPYDVFLAACDRSLVKVEMDLYWMAKGGGDPLAYFAKYPGRFPMVHVKDMSQGAGQEMVDLGTGRIDFKGIFAKSAQAGITHYFVENDEPKDPMAFARSAATYLKRLEY